MALSERQKVVHLLRRFGAGATYPELTQYLNQGAEGTMSKLLAIQDEPAHPHPFQFFFQKKDEADPASWRVAGYWMFQALTSTSPLRDRLALFWHDHFAVDENKVESGLSMLGYVQAIRANPLGRFEGILKAVVRSPAFLKMLDVRVIKKGSPNENFARELLELYTFGLGNYSEKDIQEISRVMTGWSYVDTYWEISGTNDQKLRSMERSGAPFQAFAWIPEFHDSDEKTFLGYKGKYNGDQLLALLAQDKRCAKFICSKLWDYFAAIPLPAAVLERLVKVYLSTKGEIKSVLASIMTAPEFMSEACFGQRIKCPFDLIMGIERGFKLDTFLRSQVRPAAFDEPIPDKVRDIAGSLAYQMNQMGMSLLYAPSVSGWDWGPGWISAQQMMKRLNYGSPHLWEELTPKKWTPTDGLKALTAHLQGFVANGPEAVANALLDYADVSHATPTLRKVITDHMAAENLANMDENGRSWRYTLAMKLVLASPEFHLH